MLASCSKPLLVSHLSPDEYWKVKKEKKRRAAFGSLGGPGHSIFSPIVCWDKMCRYQRGRSGKVGKGFKRYKKSGPPIKRVIPDAPTKMVEQEMVVGNSNIVNDSLEISSEYKPAPSYQIHQKYQFQTLQFDMNKSTIRQDSYEELDKIFDYMRQSPELSLMITGHTDAIGSEQLNKELSTARAREVFEYLVSKGISSNRMGFKGLGSEEPLTNIPERSEDNRRVEFEFSAD